MSIVIGIDPDSKKHGLAFYEDGHLVHLDNVDLHECMAYMSDHNGAEWVIEDVCANNFVYARNNQKTKALQSQVGRAIGKVQQSQIELMRMLDRFGAKYKLIKPTKGNWAKNKAQFERVTGWTKRSNEETRSAAYFGYMGVSK